MTTDWRKVFIDLRRLAGNRPPEALSEEIGVPKDTIDRWMKEDFLPTRRPAGENGERALQYVERLRERERQGVRSVGRDMSSAWRVHPETERKAAAWDALITGISAVVREATKPPDDGEVNDAPAEPSKE